jgi:S-formylglutathione hydrolase
MELKKQWKCFGGWQRVYTHQSEATKCPMEWSVFEPELQGGTLRPVLYFLSGLTCTWENCTTKGGIQEWASQLGIVVVWPDTSPRGTFVPDVPGEDGLGQGAGFYVDAILAPWSTNYQMETYVRRELPALVEGNVGGLSGKRGIFGHSMGGHGALTLALKYPEFYHSVSAFSPIVAPSLVPWGQRAFTNYLGSDVDAWKAHDACELIQSRGYPRPILVDVGDQDPFLERELLPKRFAEACSEKGVDLTLRMQPGYDHSYYFISTFMREHLEFHNKALTHYSAT